MVWEVEMRVLSFEYRARTGHFLRAEGGTAWMSYPFPPRTVLLGLLGAVLGMEKDTPQRLLERARFAVSGPAPMGHWHKAQIRQDRYLLEPRGLKHTREPNPKLQNQQWLWRPCYQVDVALEDHWQQELEQRLEQERYHFSPCMGMSEMLAEVEFKGTCQALPLPENVYDLQSLCPRDVGTLQSRVALERELALSFLRMPVSVNAERVFVHREYLYERDGRPLPVKTAEAWQLGDRKVVWM